MNVFGFLSKSVRTKVMVPFVVIVLGTVAVLTIVNVLDARSSTKDNAVASLSSEAALNAEKLEQGLGEVATDLVVMTNVPPVQAIFRATANGGTDPVSGDTEVIWKNRLSTIFKAFTSKGFYAQVRLLDATGQELVRIDYDGAEATRKPEDALQNKSGSGYFADAAGLETGEIYLSAFNLNRENGQVQVPHNPMIRLSTPVHNPAGDLVGVIVTNVYGNDFIASLGISGEVTTYLLDSDGAYLSHPDDAQRFGTQLETGYSFVADFGENTAVLGTTADATAEGKVLAYTGVNLDAYSTSSAWTLVAQMDSSALPSPSLVKPLVIGGILLAIAALVAFWIAQMVVGPVKTLLARLEEATDQDLAELESGIKAMEAGDLTKEVSSTTADIPNPGADEVGAASRAVNGMLARLRSTSESYGAARTSLSEMITGMQKSSATLLGSANQLDEASRQMADGTTQITTAINDVTEGSQELSALAQESSSEVSMVATGSEELASSAKSYASAAESSRDEATLMGTRIAAVASAADDVSDSANDSRSAALEGQKAVQQAVGSMENIAAAVDRASGTVNQLGEYGEQIGNIVQTIDEIAAQTNLLALNAAIEAARAGEQGRGFAVVADNVRTLAERSSDATKEIADLVGKVQAGTQEAVVAMEAGVRDVEAGREITSKAGESLASIIKSVEASAEQMLGIASDVKDVAAGAERIVTSTQEMATAAQQSADSAGEMAGGTARVSDAIGKVSGVSERTSATTEEVAATTEELSAQAQELSATAVQMKGLADEMEAATGKFQV